MEHESVEVTWSLTYVSRRNERSRGQLDKYWDIWEGLTVLVHIPESVISEDSTRQHFKHPPGDSKAHRHQLLNLHSHVLQGPSWPAAPEHQPLPGHPDPPIATEIPQRGLLNVGSRLLGVVSLRNRLIVVCPPYVSAAFECGNAEEEPCAHRVLHEEDSRADLPGTHSPTSRALF